MTIGRLYPVMAAALADTATKGEKKGGIRPGLEFNEWLSKLSRVERGEQAEALK